MLFVMFFSVLAFRLRGLLYLIREAVAALYVSDKYVIKYMGDSLPANKFMLLCG